jgi:hypothetical protein
MQIMEREVLWRRRFAGATTEPHTELSESNGDQG